LREEEALEEDEEEEEEEEVELGLGVPPLFSPVIRGTASSIAASTSKASSGRASK
jgi:hypothetical protein